MPDAINGDFYVYEAGHPVTMIGAFAAANQVPDLPDN